METMMAAVAPTIKEVGHLSSCFVLLNLGHHLSFQKELGGYNATDDALHSEHPIWHAPAELARESGSMSLGTSLV
jgi:hypothetical protein